MAPPAAPFVPKAQPFVPKVNTPEFTPTVPQPVLQQPPGLNPYAQIAGPAGLGLGLGGGNGVGEAVGGGGGAMLGGGGGMLTQQLGALGIQQQQDQQVGLGMEVKEVARKTYPSLLPHAVRQMQQSAAASAGQGQTYFVDEQLRMQLIQQHMAVEATFDEVHPDVPVEVDNYHTLCPIEPINTDGGASVFGFPSVVYKVCSIYVCVSVCLCLCLCVCVCVCVCGCGCATKKVRKNLPAPHSPAILSLSLSLSLTACFL